MKRALLSLLMIHICIGFWACHFIEEILHTDIPVVESCTLETDHFLIRFSTGMDQNMTEQAFNLTEGDTELEGQFFWEENQFSFIPYTGILNNKKYILSLKDSAEDTYGNSLMKTERWVFETGDDYAAPHILSVHPADQSVLEDNRQIITISFSESIDKFSLYKALEIKPALSHRLEWADNSSSVRIVPLEDFSYGREYNITISSLLCDRAGNKLNREYEVYYEIFEKEGLTLESLSLENSGTELLLHGINRGIEKDDRLHGILNRRAESDEIYGVAAIKPETPFFIDWNSDYTSFSLGFPEHLVYEQTYEVTILDNLYVLQCRGEQSIPPAIDSIYFCPQEGIAAVRELSLNNALGAYDSLTAYLEFNLTHSPAAQINQSSFMKAFSIESTVLSFNLLSLELESTDFSGRSTVRVNLEISDTGFPGTVHISMDETLSDNRDNYLDKKWAMTVNQP